MVLNFFGDYAANNNTPNIENSLHSIIQTAHANIINVEAPCEIIGRKPLKKSGSILSQSDKSIEWLLSNGFNGFTLANNHIMDYGEANALKTINLLGEKRCCGFGDYNTVLKPLLFESCDERIAIISVSHHEFGVVTNKIDKYELGVGAATDPRICNQIRTLKDSGYFVIVVPHAGIEHIEQPLPEWREVYRSFIDAGASAVIGSHPHIIQGWEIYENKPIFYSLGNFYFPSNKRSDRAWTSSLCVQLIFEGANMTFNITPIEFTTSTIRVSRNTDLNNYITRINATLMCEEDYIAYIKAQCDRLYNLYTASLAVGGWEGVYKPFLFIKRFFKILFNKPDYIHTHLINNLRCESHRWAIVRALRDKLNIQ